MDIMQKIRVIADSAGNIHLEEAKKSGGKIMGYFCSYIPEEILHAAGFIPYRMRAVGSDYMSKGDVYYSHLNCSFVRHCFDMVFRKEYEFLDGVIFMNACDNIRRMYDNWRHARDNQDIKPEFLYMFVAPHVLSADSLIWYATDIMKLKAALEERFNVRITDENLANSIKLYNKKRRLLRSIDEKRKRSGVSITGADFLSIMLAVTALPVEIANDLLLEIVADSICLGSRYFNTEVNESDKPIQGIARRYLNKLSCPRMVNCFYRRSKSIFDIIKGVNADALIAVRLKFCDLWGVENLLLKKEANRMGYPILLLEREVYGDEMGQIKTRVQAFVEMVRNNMRINDKLS